MISISELGFLLSLRKAICVFFSCKLRTWNWLQQYFLEECDKNKYKTIACSCICSHLVSESLLVVLIASLLNNILSVIERERKERNCYLVSGLWQFWRGEVLAYWLFVLFNKNKNREVKVGLALWEYTEHLSPGCGYIGDFNLRVKLVF